MLDIEITIADFLIEIASDPEKLLRLVQQGPKPFIESDERLRPHQKRLLLSGDVERIRHVIEYELGIDPVTEMRTWLLLVPPGPPPPSPGDQSDPGT